MSQQNFVQQINLFMDFGKRNRLTSYERMFWLGLFHCANELAQASPDREWPDDYFPVQNAEFTAWSGLEERNIRAIRNRFKQMGLIDYRKGDGKKGDPEYRIYYLHMNGYKIEPDNTEADTENGQTGDKSAPGTVSGTVTDSVSGTVTDDPKTGDKFAPGTVTDKTSKPSKINGFEAPINVNNKNIKVNLKVKGNEERARERTGGNFAPGGEEAFQSGGFVDLSQERPYTEGGFVALDDMPRPLPWAEGAYR